MKLVVGLGNPGNQYLWTRHNIGFLALDYYFKRNHATWREKPFLGAIRGQIGDVLFIKPQNYYNETGGVVANYMRHFKIPASDIVVICDNFDLEFGKVRYRASGAAAGNNGLKSIDAALGDNNYPRIRIGTQNDALKQKLGDVDFVLSRFTSEEKSALPEILSRASDSINSSVV